LEDFRETITGYGVPNYFGPQRLGGSNAEVGEAIKDGDLGKATEIVLEKVRIYLNDGNIGNIPKVYWYEKKILRHLTKFPNDYAGALRKVPRKILSIYVHAYQSKIFNENLQQSLHENNIPETITIPGFQVPKMPELTTPQITRKSLLIARNFRAIKVKTNFAILKFTLEKGEYATTLISSLIN